VYLGALVTPKNDVGLEKQRRIQAAKRSSHLPLQIKLTINRTLIRPVLLHGSETWVLTKVEENRLLVFERKVLRMIYGPKIVDAVYRSRHNFQLFTKTLLTLFVR
jgi:hypothetical protein